MAEEVRPVRTSRVVSSVLGGTAVAVALAVLAAVTLSHITTEWWHLFATHYTEGTRK